MQFPTNQKLEGTNNYRSQSINIRVTAEVARVLEVITNTKPDSEKENAKQDKKDKRIKALILINYLPAIKLIYKDSKTIYNIQKAL